MHKEEVLACAALVLAGALMGAGAALHLTAARGSPAGAGMRREPQDAVSPGSPGTGDRTRPMPRPLGDATEAALPELEETKGALSRARKRSASLEAELDRLRAELERIKAQRDRLARTLKLSVKDEPGPPAPPKPPAPTEGELAPPAPGDDLAPPAGP